MDPAELARINEEEHGRRSGSLEADLEALEQLRRALTDDRGNCHLANYDEARQKIYAKYGQTPPPKEGE